MNNQFKQKENIIKAVRFLKTKESVEEISRFLERSVSPYSKWIDEHNPTIYIQVLNFLKPVEVGSWIVKHNDFSLWTYKDEEFKRLYEQLENQ